jgi:hypothetical protein
MQDSPKFTQIGIFGLQLYHLATLVGNRVSQKAATIFKDFIGNGCIEPAPAFATSRSNGYEKMGPMLKTPFLYFQAQATLIYYLLLNCEQIFVV